MGSSAPQLPAASQPASQPAAVEPRFRGSFRPRRLEDRAYLTTATSCSIVHCHQPHSLVLSGKRAALGAWGISHTSLERKRSAHSEQRRKSYWIIQRRHEHTRQALLNDWSPKRSGVHCCLVFAARQRLRLQLDCKPSELPLLFHSTYLSQRFLRPCSELG